MGGWAAATALATVTAWAGNRWAVPLWGLRGVTYLSPLVEEAAKTFWAIGLAGPAGGGGLVPGGQIILVHTGFGVIEGVRDVIVRRAGRRRAGPALTPVFGAVLSHLVFGVVTVTVAEQVTRRTKVWDSAGPWFWPWLVGAAAAFVLHVIWNLLVVRAAVEARPQGAGARRPGRG